MVQARLGNDVARVPKPAAPARAITELIERLGYGNAAQQMSEEVQQLLAKMHKQWVEQKHGIKGRYTIVIDFNMKPDDGSLVLGWDSKTKEPPKLRPGAVLFVKGDGNWTEDDPRQLKLGDFAGERSLAPTRREERSIPPAQAVARDNQDDDSDDEEEDWDPETGEVTE